MNIRSLIRTNPVKSPLMGRFKVRVVTVVSNFKNYAVGLEGYRRSFDWRTFVLPYFKVSTSRVSYAEDATVKPTSLSDYLGYQVGWYPNMRQYTSQYEGDDYAIKKNAFPFLVYYDFYRNYLVNPQVGYFPIFKSGEGRASMVEMVDLSQFDKLFEEIHKYYDGTNSGSLQDIETLTGSASAFLKDSLYVNSIAYHAGLVGTLFDPDINTEWLSTNNFARLQSVRVNTQSVSSADSHVDFADIVKASSLWDFITREIYGGGTYADHIYSQFGVSVKSDMNIPQIVHIFDSMVDFEDITSQSETEGAVVGEQFGVGRGYGQSSRFTIRNLDNNYAYAMSFMWITPMVDYATGLPEDSNITSFTDLYSPSFDNYAMQPRFFENVDMTPYVVDGEVSSESLKSDRVIGYQPAWSEYKTATNRVHGLFADQLSYWTIVRKTPQIGSNILSHNNYPVYVYQAPIGVAYDEATACQYYLPFSVVNEDNFFYQLRFDVVATRSMSKSVIPHVK